MTEKTKEVNFLKNHLVPKHELLSYNEAQELLKKFNVSLKQLPKIKQDDPAIKHLNAKRGSIIKITRKSPTAGIYFYYRVVI
ncbi:MAG: DNA-directed RNA polymerase subunit H [Candidatus Aenigmarchaeota archaeon]|nr:DNA-directed RNA polymerase subunit H [Candidatus Aenigmarchaeota archaeon]